MRLAAQRRRALRQRRVCDVLLDSVATSFVQRRAAQAADALPLANDVVLWSMAQVGRRARATAASRCR